MLFTYRPPNDPMKLEKKMIQSHSIHSKRQISFPETILYRLDPRKWLKYLLVSLKTFDLCMNFAAPQ